MPQISHKSRWLIAGIIGLILLGIVGWLLGKPRGYTAADINQAKVTVKGINQQFAGLAALPTSNDAATEFANDKALQSAYRSLETQFDVLRQSPVQRNASVHTAFASLDSAWQAKDAYIHDYLSFFLIFDGYNASATSEPPNSSVTALSNYKQQLQQAQDALAKLQKIHPKPASLVKAKHDFSTYLQHVIPLDRTAVTSLQQPPSGSTPLYYLDVEANINPKLKAPSETYIAAMTADIKNVNADLQKHTIAAKVQRFSKTLDHLQPNS